MTALIRLAALALLLGSCAPMTFSHDADVDFEVYASVLVTVDAPISGASEYLAAELRAGSGFERVTTDPSQPVDLVLSVTVSVHEDITVDSNGDIDVSYDAIADYSAATPAGRVVTEGSETDTSDTHTEAAEDVLDEVALHFLAPYRI